MNRRSLGRVGIDVSELSLGTVSLGLPYGIGVEGPQDMLAESDALDLLRSALEQGVNFYDTANFYGQSEALLGKAFAGRRDQVVICSKSTHYHKPSEPLPSGQEIRKMTDKSLQQSLSALQTSYIDIYMLHNANMQTLSHPEIIDLFTNYKKKGVIRATGASVYTVEEAMAAIESGIWDVIQVGYNLMDQRMGPVFSLARQHGVGVVIRSVLLKGILTDRGRELHPELTAVQQHRDSYSELFSETAPTLSELAMKFVLSQPDVSSVLVGIDKMDYLQTALNVADGVYLDERALTRANELAYPDPDFLDLPKWDTLGWLN